MFLLTLLKFSVFSCKEYIINLISVLTIRQCLCVELCLVLLEEGFATTVCYLGKSHFYTWFTLYSQSKLACYSKYLLDFLLLHSSPLWWKGHLLLILILKDHHRTIWLQLLQLSHWGLDLDYCDGEWFALEMNWDSTKPICYSLDGIVHQRDSLISSPHTVFSFMN